MPTLTARQKGKTERQNKRQPPQRRLSSFCIIASAPRLPPFVGKSRAVSIVRGAVRKRRKVCAALRHGLPQPADKKRCVTDSIVRGAVRKRRMVCAALRHGLPLPRGQERCVTDGNSKGCGD